jgi:prolyl-tRNA editing enzyme YbaK/EbsC (Cys-tRNA(Pro) deacylase)
MTMPDTLSPSAQKVQNLLRDSGFTNQVIELSKTTRTALDAAQAIGCRVEQIVKSLIFKTHYTHRPILVVASGANRVNEKKLGAHLGEKITKPDAEFVRHQTGYTIGGVAPIGLPEELEIFIDEGLLQYTEIWAAASNPNAVFNLSPDDLQKMTGGGVISIL